MGTDPAAAYPGRGSGLRVLVAPDKFKGTLTGAEAAAAISAGVRAALPAAQISTAVIADGGEGTVEAAVSAGARASTAVVTGPLGAPIEARWCTHGDRAVIELAAASGLQLLAPDPSTALAATSRGTGELIAAALDSGANEILLGLGGSACTDGGAGLLRALGARFLAADGQEIPDGGGALSALDRVELSSLDPRLRHVPITVAADVRTPLLGPAGAAAVFGPQKGAGPAQVAQLERGLAVLAQCLQAATGRDAAALDWGGAAGGCAGGLNAALGAQFRPGLDVVAELVDLTAQVRRADLVVVGEGSLDKQSLQGKAPVAVARRARAAGVPVLAVAGRVTVDRAVLAAEGILGHAAASEHAPSPADALGPRAGHWVSVAAEHAVRTWLGGAAVREDGRSADSI
ncbi:glycerate kinase [Ruania halotolerans]|uniref:glycerate kinase n=1 Tax=Ruania halotolerans TaxID=2897773 RepID=UPI001E3B365F|nr:glycerate kinase [Ruania halotolerans]UFU07905.1 glycerate kinase [Ruania halotolerans]